MMRRSLMERSALRTRLKRGRISMTLHLAQDQVDGQGVSHCVSDRDDDSLVGQGTAAKAEDRRRSGISRKEFSAKRVECSGHVVALRSHSGQERFRVMTISDALFQKFEKTHEQSNKVRIITKAPVRSR